jgi:hypothetical protein
VGLAIADAKIASFLELKRNFDKKTNHVKNCPQLQFNHIIDHYGCLLLQ